MRPKADPSKFGRGLAFWLIVIACAAIALALLAPTAVGGLLGDLWVTTMSAVVGLLGGALGGS
jgi:hypothetical protein